MKLLTVSSCFALVFLLTTFAHCQETEIDVEIEYETGRETRSLNGPQEFKVVIKNDVILKLKPPPSSIFATNFKYTVATSDGGLTDETPNKGQIRSLESHIFLDQKNDAVMKVGTNKDGLIVMEGIVEDTFISPGRQQPGRAKVNSKPTYTAKNLTTSQHVGRDYIDLHRNITFNPIKRQTKATTIAVGETWVVLDYDHAAQFGFNRERILSYLATFFRAVNNRYATISEPKISFTISGITIISSRSAQPFVENSRVPDGSGFDIGMVLEDFSKWAYTTILPSFPQVDMAALLSSTDFQKKDEFGIYQKNLAGLAYMKGACWKDTYGKRLLATSVSEDLGGFYDGVYTVAHEFAHNLASPHDGFEEAAGCSWEEGYIMSYNGWGTTKKFYFSPCSIHIMNKFILSSGGACMRNKEGSTPLANPDAAPEVGNQLDMKSMCIKHTNSPQAIVDPTKSPTDLCTNLVCTYLGPNSVPYITTTNRSPGDNSICGNGGRCLNGQCVGDQGVRVDMTEQCVRYTGKATAVPDNTRTAEQLCQQLQCKYTDPNQPGWIWTWKSGSPIPDYGTVCDGGRGRCIYGACV
ncbi:uncharacterized protein LOC110845644 [Folsomia candida]|uniref:Venom metalloproteinase antarease-like n=1 Tax=Folsomia candida TaxID=158441 RepID=A0A226EGW8_FOLCA|nr:uncharacterized protein LOC110845644 [Folsomia candida]OXA56903.1 Venom metalloproteinase antarease-like [Folsomia candida]